MPRLALKENKDVLKRVCSEKTDGRLDGANDTLALEAWASLKNKRGTIRKLQRRSLRSEPKRPMTMLSSMPRHAGRITEVRPMGRVRVA